MPPNQPAELGINSLQLDISYLKYALSITSHVYSIYECRSLQNSFI